MLIIWKKWGILTPVIGFGGMIGSGLLFHLRGRAQCVDLFIAAALLFIVGHWLAKKKQANELFVVPMKYWSILAALAGFAILFGG